MHRTYFKLLWHIYIVGRHIVADTAWSGRAEPAKSRGEWCCLQILVAVGLELDSPAEKCAMFTKIYHIAIKIIIRSHASISSLSNILEATASSTFHIYLYYVLFVVNVDLIVLFP